MVSVYEVTGNYDVIAIGKFADTDGMNSQIKELLVDPEIKGVQHQRRAQRREGARAVRPGPRGGVGRRRPKGGAG